MDQSVANPAHGQANTETPVPESIATVCLALLLSSCGTSSPVSTPASSSATPLHVAWINETDAFHHSEFTPSIA